MHNMMNMFPCARYYNVFQRRVVNLAYYFGIDSFITLSIFYEEIHHVDT